MYVSEYAGLGASTPDSPAKVEVDQLNIKLMNIHTKLSLKLVEVSSASGWLKQLVTTDAVKDRILTAIKTLNDTMNGPFARLASKAKDGDADALQRLRQVTKAVVVGMGDVIYNLDHATAENIKQMVSDIDADLSKVSGKVAAAAAGGASTALWAAVKNAPFVTIGAGVIVAALVYGKFK